MEAARVIQWNQVNRAMRDYNPSHPDYRNRFLAEGDSWFTVGGLPAGNLLYALRCKRSTIVVSMAKPGDVLRNMSDMCNEELRRALTRQFGDPWDAILLSAGGNDLIEYVNSARPERRLLVPANERGSVSGPADYFYVDRLNRFLEEYIKRGYRQIVAWRDRPESGCSNKPVIVHTYDWVTPINVGARPFPFGPWLYPALVREEIPKSDWIATSDYMLGRFGDALLSLESELPNFHVVDTRGTLVRADLDATGSSNGWLNEIHPTSAGYKQLSKKIMARLQPMLPS